MKKTFVPLNFGLLLFFVLINGYASAQWNAENYVQITSDSWPRLSIETQNHSNGNTYIFFRTSKNDLSTMESYLQVIDPAGNKLLPDSGLLISGDKPTPTAVYVNKHLLVDKDGNAIVVVPDNRHGASSFSYTAYKISPNGTFLWGNEGIDLNRGVYPMFQSNLNIVQLEDGSYAFAWSQYSNLGKLFIALERVSEDGSFIWENINVSNAGSNYTYPYLVNAGDNQLILVYAIAKTKYELWAHKINADGTAAWNSDMLVYNGGFANNALQTIVDVQPSTNGSVWIAWNDDRAKTAKESVYLSCIKPDRTYGFTAGSEGLKTGHAGNRSFRPKILTDKNDDAAYVVWEENDATQKNERLMLQKISPSGNLLWGENGIEAMGWSERLSYDINLVADNDKNVSVFYIHKENTGSDAPASTQLRTFSENDGSLIGSKQFVTANDGKSKSNLQVNEITNNHWTALWQSGNQLYVSKVAPNVFSGLQESVISSESIIVAHEGETTLKFTVNLPGYRDNLSISLYDISGKKTADIYHGYFDETERIIRWDASQLQNGIYIALVKTVEETVAVKISR